MVNQKLKIVRKQVNINDIILVDHFDFEYLKEEEGALKYKLITRDQVLELLHSGLREVYACVTNQKIKNILEREFHIEVPLAKDEYECGIDIDDFYHNVWILSPLISQYDLDRDEQTLSRILASSGPRYVLYTMAKEVV